MLTDAVYLALSGSQSLVVAFDLSTDVVATAPLASGTVYTRSAAAQSYIQTVSGYSAAAGVYAMCLVEVNS